MFKRFRRVRVNPIIRDLVEESRVETRDFIYPLFAKEGKGVKKEIVSMPGVFQMSVDEIIKECEGLLKLGLNKILLFGIPDVKDSIGSDALSEDGIIARAVREIKKVYGKDLLIATDLCFCEYTDHGHCGILDLEHNSVDNDATLEITQKQALIHAYSGSDLIAPSGMMDGTVEAIRDVLDENGFVNLPIMSYSTKFSSAYYGPFRDVAESCPSFGDRKSYQMNFSNRREALAESLEDEAQGADILMVKPALAYLDIVRDIREASLLPLCVYNVSGEYSMLKAAGKAGVIDYEKVLMETLTSFKRAGADIIISYHAKEAAELLAKSKGYL
ncbi:MAG: porphobilinogen synthase [Campylobacteraceae bacterium]|jgi:porphobilinogen synthase|nr:porphobilinogen synthase [Campylobacteraceae bacterium]